MFQFVFMPHECIQNNIHEELNEVCVPKNSITNSCVTTIPL